MHVCFILVSRHLPGIILASSKVVIVIKGSEPVYVTGMCSTVHVLCTQAGSCFCLRWFEERARALYTVLVTVSLLKWSCNSQLQVPWLFKTAVRRLLLYSC
jgi:hypothetical protein